MIYVFYAHGFEEIEGITPVDVLRRGDFTVKTVGVGGKTITGAHGLTVHCDISHREVHLDKMDMLVLPGGQPGTNNLMGSEAVQEALAYGMENNLWVGALCAAPMILGRKGYLEGKKATIFPGMEEELVGATLEKGPVVQDGKIITGNGPAAALGFSLKLLEALGGKEKAKEIGDGMQWQNGQ